MNVASVQTVNTITLKKTCVTWIGLSIICKFNTHFHMDQLELGNIGLRSCP
jgi:hypothetical protein